MLSKFGGPVVSLMTVYVDSLSDTVAGEVEVVEALPTPFEGELSQSPIAAVVMRKVGGRAHKVSA